MSQEESEVGGNKGQSLGWAGRIEEALNMSQKRDPGELLRINAEG
jgi:hypothetical protein